MSEQTAIVSVKEESHFLAPAATIQQAVDRFKMMGQFVSAVMRKDVDFGVIPGTGNKPTLLKPGAEKLTTLFGLSARFRLVESVSDWTGKDHEGEPFFYFHYQAQILRGEHLIAEGEGSANSWEKKYRYRTADLVCPECGKPTLLKSKKDPGWFCWTKKGGCGANFGPADQRITGQERGQVKNPDVADLVNTLQKMAQKRAYIAGVLLATNASEYFTQDIEDFADSGIVEGSYTEMPMEEQKPAQTYHQAQPPKSNGNGKSDGSEPPTAKAWEQWKNLSDEAVSLNIGPDVPPENVTIGELRAMYAELNEKVKAAKAA